MRYNISFETNCETTECMSSLLPFGVALDVSVCVQVWLGGCLLKITVILKSVWVVYYHYNGDQQWCVEQRILLVKMRWLNGSCMFPTDRLPLRTSMVKMT